jgi:ATP-dependent Clp protease ATP-binding subunit ClpC
MATFDIAQARNFRKTIAGKKVESPFMNIVAKTAFVLCFTLIIAYYYGYSQGISAFEKFPAFLLGLLLAYLFLFYFLKGFYQTKVYLESDNLAEGLSVEMASVVLSAVEIARESKFNALEPVILLAAFEKNEDGKYLLLRCGFGLEKDLSTIISETLAKIPRGQGGELQFPADFIAVIEAARLSAQKSARSEIVSGDILVGLIEKSDVFQKLMFEIKIEQVDISRVVEWHELLKSYGDRQKVPFWEKLSGGGIGRDWSFGYTPMLSQFARNINTEVEFSGETHVYGRSNEIEEIERILAKSGKNNVLMVGEHGIGKKTIVKGFVSKIVRGDVLPSLKYSQVFQVDTGAVLSGSGDSGEIAMRVKKIFNEAARAGNIILFFDNFHALVSRDQGVGQVNTSEIILPYLEGAVNVIGATTLKEYHKNVEANPGVAADFTNITVKEPTKDETVQVLEEMIPYIEHRDGVFWPYQAVREAVRVSDRYIHNKPFPEKAIGIVDEVSVQVARSGQKVVFSAAIDDMVSKELEVPVAQAEGEEAAKLLNLENFLHQRVIGQEEAISAVANAMRRARSGIQSRQRPIGTFLFLGPTGVGKTETSKALAAAYFGSDKNMIRIDMSEFQEQSSIYRLIGSPPAAGAEGEKGQLTTAVSDNPFALVLLDELEKAHKDILTLFLQVFDDGRLTDGTGQVVDFTNTIIIATSNAGSELIRESIQKGVHGEDLKKGLLDFLQKQGIFRPEFLNRFDAVVAFHPLTQPQILQVAQLMLASLNKTMAEKEITLNFTPAAVQKLAQVGFDPVYGARPMRRAIQDKVENVLATSILEGKIPRGSSVTIDEKDIN